MTKESTTKSDAVKVSIEIDPASIVDATEDFEKGTPQLVTPAEAKRLVSLTYNGQPVFRVNPRDQE